MNTQLNHPDQIDLLKAAMDSCKCGVTIADATDPEMPVIYANHAFAKLTGYGHEECLGRNCRFLQGEFPNEEARRQIREAISSQRSVTVVLRNQRQDGSEFWNELHLAPVRTNGRLTHYVGVQNDITSEVRAREMLQHSEESLRELLKEQEQLIGIAAHDLRNPMALVHSLAELAEAAAPQERGRILATIQQVSRKALDMVGEILNLQAIQHGSVQLDRQQVHLAEFLRAYCESAHTTCSLKEIGFDFVGDSGDLPLHVRFDPGRIERVLDNLLTNAVKYSKRGTRITLRACCNGGHLEFSVEDQGQGIPKEEIPLLFKPFSKASSSPTEGEHSSGLGLAISKRLVELHGGEITVTSEPSQGSTFTIRIPLED